MTNTSPTYLLSVNGLSLSFGETTLFADVSFELAMGESLAVMGRSGSGKSSLLSCILGLIRADSGEIMVSGNRVESLRGSAMARLRREKIGMIFQSGELLPELSPLDNVLVAGLLGGQSVRAATKRSEELLEGLSVPRSDRTMGGYSGGEQQRVAVARALVNSPQLILADEPTGSLDTETRDEVLELLRSLPSQFACALVVVTHDPVVAAACGRQVRLTDGALREIMA